MTEKKLANEQLRQELHENGGHTVWPVDEIEARRLMTEVQEVGGIYRVSTGILFVHQNVYGQRLTDLLNTMKAQPIDDEPEAKASSGKKPESKAKPKTGGSARVIDVYVIGSFEDFLDVLRSIFGDDEDGEPEAKPDTKNKPAVENVCAAPPAAEIVPGQEPDTDAQPDGKNVTNPSYSVDWNLTCDQAGKIAKILFPVLPEGKIPVAMVGKEKVTFCVMDDHFRDGTSDR